MKLYSINILDAPPIERFQASKLTSRVVIAGPNGVGKTNLNNAILSIFQNQTPDTKKYIEVQATNAAEKEEWNTDLISTSTPEGCAKLRQTLQRVRRRQKWQSSLLLFESDRTIGKINPVPYTFEVNDPDSEEIHWNITFGGIKNRWQDTQNSIFRKIIARRDQLGNAAARLADDGKPTMQLHSKNPLIPFKKAFDALLGPKEFAKPDIATQTLYYKTANETLPISKLSSEEKEVVNIAFDIILRTPSDCIFLFDEPELHLHPELTYRLMKTLEGIGERNQFVLFSHSPDIISSSIDDTVLFMRPPKGARNQAVPSTTTDESVDALRALGQSVGVISLGKKIVLIEGTHSSVDKKIYSNIVQNRFPDFVLLPAGGADTIQSFDHIVSSILENSIWGVDFFMLRDRDHAVLGHDATDSVHTDRLRSLPRYHLENYFLEENVWKIVFTIIDAEQAWLKDAQKIRSKLHQIASASSGLATSLLASASLRNRVGHVSCVSKGVSNRSLNAIISGFQDSAIIERNRVISALHYLEIERVVTEVHDKVQRSLSDGDEWKSVIPGRPVLNTFLKHVGVDQSLVRRKYIACANELDDAQNPFSDVFNIFEVFNKIANAEA